LRTSIKLRTGLRVRLLRKLEFMMSLTRKKRPD